MNERHVANSWVVGKRRARDRPGCVTGSFPPE
jgi:hypothetical protein